MSIIPCNTNISLSQSFYRPSTLSPIKISTWVKPFSVEEPSIAKEIREKAKSKSKKRCDVKECYGYNSFMGCSHNEVVQFMKKNSKAFDDIITNF